MFFLLVTLPLLCTSQPLQYLIDAHTDCNNVYDSIKQPKNSTEWVTYLGSFSTTEECINECIKTSTDNNKCYSYTYFTSQTQNKYSLQCYGRFGSIYGIVWTPQPYQYGINCGRIIYACKNDLDCELNGYCNIDSGYCTCRPAWNGPRCQQLNLLPATKGTGYHITNDNSSGKPTSSWGGAVLKDFTSSDTAISYHMYLAEFDNHCGVNSWTINSVVTHAQSTNGYNSEYKRVSVIHSHFAHEPDAINGPNGEYVIYYATWDYGNFPECQCSDGSTNTTCNTPDPPYFQDYMQYSLSPNGPWSNPQIIFEDRNNTILTQQDDTNLAGVILSNGSFIGMFRVAHWETDGSEIHLVTSNNWKIGNNYIINNNILFPQLPYGTEDPFLYIDCNGYFHALFHNLIGTQYIPGGHAYSLNGIDWIYSGYIYTNNVLFNDGSNFTFSRRERPHFIFANDNCTPIALTNGVQYGGTYGDATYTLVQPIKH